MKFVCKKEDLVQAIQIVVKAVSPKQQNPIMSGIYLKTEGNSLILQATDYEIGIICKIDAEVELPGEVVLSGRYAQEVIRRLPGVNVSIEYNHEDNLIHIKSNLAKFSFLCMEATDYPTIKKLEGDVKFIVSDNSLRELIISTSFACSHDEGRPVFTGCLLELNDDNILMVATDTHRLAVQSEKLEEFQGQRKLIIPAKLLNELAKILQSDLPRSVKVSCTSNQICFEIDNIYIASRLIDGQFPDYHRVIPPEFKTHITLNTEEIRSIVDRVALISRTNDYNVITMEFANSKVKIYSNNPEVGNGEEYAAAVINGEDISISFNADYVNDGLKIIKSKEFSISLNAPLSPAAIRTDENPNFVYIITPVRS